MRVLFKNMERSELAVQIVEDRLGQVIEKFPRFHESNFTATLSTENSPLQAGPDMFTVCVRLSKGLRAPIILKKTAPSLYAALAQVCDRLQDLLNKASDRDRVVARRRQKKFPTQKLIN